MGEYATLVADAALRQRAREAEHAARIEAELSRKIESEFLAKMSHELRTPLDAVIAFSRLIGECERLHLSNEQVVAYADLIHGAAMCLQAVINDTVEIDSAKSPGSEVTVTPASKSDASPLPDAAARPGAAGLKTV